MRGLTLLLLGALLALPALAEPPTEEEARQRVEALQESLYNPFVERYVLDELKSLRTELQAQRTEFTARVTRAQLESADRAVNYATSTVNNIFYIIAAAASIFALVGWSSLRDMRQRLNEVVERKVTNISEEYEKRLYDLEQKLRDRTERIISAQEEITRTNTLHSLWMRAGLEATPQARIEVYDQVLAINPEDVEALTYKADMVLEIGEAEWALNLCNKALALKPDYAYAHYQRACAYDTLGQADAALEDLRQAIDLSSTYLEEARNDKSLETLRHSGRLDELLPSAPTET